MKPKCGYNVPGIERINLLDFDDYRRVEFDGDTLYNKGIISAIHYSGEAVEIEVTETSKYTSTLQNGVYNHKIETFINELSGHLLADLHLATKRRYFVLFKANNGRYFAFGYEAGATVIYTAQTEGGIGAMVTISADSIYPLFESIDKFKLNVIGTEDRNILTTEEKQAIKI